MTKGRGETSSANLRREARTPFHSPANASWQTPDNKTFKTPINVIDISDHGVRFWTPVRPDANQQLTVTLDDGRSAAAEVIWVEPDESGFQIGVRATWST